MVSNLNYIIISRITLHNKELLLILSNVFGLQSQQFTSFVLQLVVNALVASIPSISNVMFVCLIFWLIFGIVGVQIFGGTFFQCVDENNERLPLNIVNNRSECEANEDIGYQWVNPKINFDNVLAAYMALLQVVSKQEYIC